MNPNDTPDPIHAWFGLSYASYLVLPRSLLQSMPAPWQAHLVGLLGVLNERYPDRDDNYDVRLRDDQGRYVADPLEDYERGRRRVAPGKDGGST
jgi:hypothetical protein